MNNAQPQEIYPDDIVKKLTQQNTKFDVVG